MKFGRRKNFRCDQLAEALYKAGITGGEDGKNKQGKKRRNRVHNRKRS